MSYQDFLERKRLIVQNAGVAIKDSSIHSMLFPFQRDLIRWACQKGRCAIFADTGLGKTFMQLEWARLVSDQCLIVAPLSVARQTVREAQKIGLDILYTRSGSFLQKGINITNYEMIESFDPKAFDAVVLDESSILKSIDGKTKAKMIEMFSDAPYRLCCTATPAPNDIAEIANHSEFLGIMSRTDMLATFFVHDDKGWRLKRHAEEPFYRWLASWGMSVRKPSDLGYDDDGYILPPLTIHPVFVKTDKAPVGQLFFTGLKGITERISARKATIPEKIEATKGIIDGTQDQWLIWTGMNQEADLLRKELPIESRNVYGSMPLDDKIAAIQDWQDGGYQTMITKAKIAGFGMNFQNCHKMIFCGLSDSYEAYYQCIRRCYRFGQEHPVDVYIVLSEIEREVYENVKAKEQEAQRMSERLIENVQQFERAEIDELKTDWQYETESYKADSFTMMLGDSVERMAEVEDNSVGLSVFSPPFLSLYTYSPTERDVGNSKTEEEFFIHLGYIIDHLLRVTIPGRNCCVHVAQVPAMLVRDGYIGMKDFRGKTIMAFEERGWTYHGECVIDKDPQVQAIRTHSKGLLFAQMKRDAAWLRPCLADYILVFRKPGENDKPVLPDLTNDEWIEFARPIWYGIKETDTLNFTEARSDRDERHIAPLQLATIERCIRLWSNKGDLICSPFAGIGSEGYQALRLDRRFVGIELKRNYWQVAVKNLLAASKRDDQLLGVI